MKSEFPFVPASRPSVLHVMPSLDVGGAEQMATHLMIGLSRTHNVGAVALSKPANSVTERRLADAGIPVWHLNKRPGFGPRMFGALRSVFDEFRPHIVHTHLAVQRYVFPMLLRSNTVLVHTLHNVAEHETDTFGQWVHWVAFRHNVLPISISVEVSASVKRVYGVEPKAMIPNCIPVEKFQHTSAEGRQWRVKNNIPSDAVVFTCVGRLEPQKNPLLLLKAFSKLKDPRAHLLFSGGGSLGRQLADSVSLLNLDGRVHLLGKRDDVSMILAASDVFALSSNWEGNPLAVMEGMAAGLPVIGTRVGGIPELVDSGLHGHLVEAGDEAAFRDAMQHLLDNPMDRARMACAARTRALQEFRLEQMVQGYSDFYQSALKRAYRTSTSQAIGVGCGS